MRLFSPKSISSKIMFSLLLAVATDFCIVPSSWIWKTDFLLTGRMHCKAGSYQDEGHPVRRQLLPPHIRHCLCSCPSSSAKSTSLKEHGWHFGLEYVRRDSHLGCLPGVGEGGTKKRRGEHMSLEWNPSRARAVSELCLEWWRVKGEGKEWPKYISVWHWGTYPSV